MRKIILYLLFFCFNALLYSQNTNVSKNIIPVSPQAGTLGQYGDVPIDLSSGKINYTIPLYTIKVGDFEYPIALSYNYNGFRTDDIPGQVGYGWSINSAGIISVQVKGGSDLGTGGYLAGGIAKLHIVPYVKNGTIPDIITGNSDNEKKFIFFNTINKSENDYEPDKYNVNAGHLNFSFTFDENGAIVFHKKRPYKVEYSTLPMIKVTDEKGSAFKFDKYEITYLETSTTNGNLSPLSGVGLATYSAFNLTSVVTNNNKEIKFTYFSKTNGIQTLSDIYKYIPAGNATSDAHPCSGYFTGHDITRNISTIDGNVVSQITFPNGKITYEYFNQSGFNKSSSLLSKMVVKNNQDKKIVEYQFVYNLSNNLLLQIKRFDSNNVEIPFYRFEYNGNIPYTFNTFAQDYWGYYNAENNQYLVGGNRSISFNNTLLGSLSRIIYPTGGTTEIAYEQNSSNSKFIDPNPDPNLLTYDASQTFGLSDFVEDQVTNQTNTLYIPFNQTVKIETYAYAGAENNLWVDTSVSVLPQNYGTSYSAVSMKRPNTTAQISKKTSFITFGPGNININNSIYTESPTNNSLNDIKTYAKISYNPTNTENYNNPAGGLRVKSTKDCSSSDCIVRNYSYNNDDGTSSGTMLYTSLFSSERKCSINGKDLPSPAGSYSAKITYGNSMAPLSTLGSPILYSKVTETMLKGSTVNKFNLGLFGVNDGYLPLIPQDLYSYNIGYLINNSIFDNSNVELVRKEYTYNQKNFTDLKSYGISINKFATEYYFYLNSFVENKNPSNFKIKTYCYTDSDVQLNNRKETQYFPQQKSLYKSEDYSYNAKNILTQTKSTTSDNEIRITNFQYAYEKNNQYLIDKNMVGIPLQTNITKNGLGVLSTETTYPLSQIEADTKTSGLPLPTSVLSYGVQIPGASSSYRTEVTYDKYDTNGNLLQYTVKGGIPTTIIWGYSNTQPIAKIEGAKYDDIKTLSEVTDMITASNSDIDQASEDILIIKLDALRKSSNFKNFQITTYTYDPLIGVTSITPPNGVREIYRYDSANRLEKVVDVNGNILKEYKYHYKQ